METREAAFINRLRGFQVGQVFWLKFDGGSRLIARVVQLCGDEHVSGVVFDTVDQETCDRKNRAWHIDGESRNFPVIASGVMTFSDLEWEEFIERTDRNVGGELARRLEL